MSGVFEGSEASYVLDIYVAQIDLMGLVGQIGLVGLSILQF